MAAVYLVGPSWSICPAPPESEVVSMTAASQGVPDFETCRVSGPLAGYPLAVVAAALMTPSLLLAVLEAGYAVRRNL